MEDVEFGGADSGASETVPIQAGSVKKNNLVCLKGHPCKVAEISFSKTGKHGHAKAHVVGIDIFTGRRYEELCPSSHNMEQPVLERKDYTLLDIMEDGYISLMDEAGNIKEDLKSPEGELGERIRADFDEGKELLLTVYRAMGMEAVVATKQTQS
eukprot:TRINITY_DN13732_c0_g1_i1.p2 TRINITY_DN13732_c0_g1~~TRINITY_DN13732_c0_g1_i1.p2  ORF type:complete len:155 (-),score=14.79 TRINITY_DN13732_c0_g1_i1:63-527(-)